MWDGIGQGEHSEQTTGVLLDVDWRLQLRLRHHCVDEQPFATRLNEPPQRVVGRVAMAALIGRDHRLRRAGAPSQVGLGEAAPPPNGPDERSWLHVSEYIVLSMFDAGRSRPARGHHPSARPRTTGTVAGEIVGPSKAIRRLIAQLALERTPSVGR